MYGELSFRRWLRDSRIGFSMDLLNKAHGELSLTFRSFWTEVMRKRALPPRLR